MLKDNHIWCNGGDFLQAVKQARSVGGFALKIEVECKNLEEAELAANSGADILMLDNFTPEMVKHAIDKSGPEWKQKGILIETSGSITIDNVAEYFCNGMYIALLN